MRVLIVDDEVYARDELRYLLEANTAITEVVDVESVSEAVVQLFDLEFDVIFLDIQLNQENGFELAQRLPKLQHVPKIVFATAYDEYAVKAFDFNASDYILKPFAQARIDRTIAKVMTQIEEENNKLSQDTAQNAGKLIETQLLPITIDGITLVLNKQDIISASVMAGMLTIHTANKDYQTHENLSWLKRRLDGNIFLQVHRSFIVNTNAIISVEPWFNHTYQLTLKDNTKTIVSRSFVPDMKARLGFEA